MFDHLADEPSFDYGLFWVGYRDREPAKHVRERLLAANKGAYFVRGFDADSFFVELAQRLKCFPPAYVERPFSHLASTLDVLTVYTMPDGNSEVDVTAKARDLIAQARQRFDQRSRGKKA